MRKITTLLFILGSFYSFGQFSTTILDYNNTSAVISDGGIFFNDESIGFAGYEVPKGNGTNAIYATSFWFGGHDQTGQLRLSGSAYFNNSDIFPGPITTDTSQYTSAPYFSQYGTSLWSVSQAEINTHILNWNQGGYVMPTSISDWPGNGDVSIGVADQLAPYVDMNGNNIYEPQLGDYPNIRGDKATYVIMNDGRSPHVTSGGERMYIEVHVMFYQFVTNDYLNDQTFMNVRVFNRGSYTYSDFKTSVYADGDIGNYMDDYVGCDSLRNMMFTYNGDSNDEDNGGNIGYGPDAPAVGVKCLSSQIMSSTYYTNAGSPGVSDPNGYMAYWNYMNGFWADGQPMVFGGTGYPGSLGSTIISTTYMLSGDPLNLTTPITPWNWTEMDTGGGSMNAPGDRRMVMTVDSIDLASGDQVCYDYVVLYGPGTPGTFPSGISTLQERADSVQIWYDNQNFGCNQVTLSLDEFVEESFTIYPNPSTGTFNVQFEGIIDQFTLSVMDLSGRTLIKKNYTNKNYISFDLDESPGVYLLQIKTTSGMQSKRIVIK